MLAHRLPVSWPGACLPAILGPGLGTFASYVQGLVRRIAGVIGDLFHGSEIKAKPAFG